MALIFPLYTTLPAPTSRGGSASFCDLSESRRDGNPATGCIITSRRQQILRLHFPDVSSEDLVQLQAGVAWSTFARGMSTYELYFRLPSCVLFSAIVIAVSEVALPPVPGLLLVIPCHR